MKMLLKRMCLLSVVVCSPVHGLDDAVASTARAHTSRSGSAHTARRPSTLSTSPVDPALGTSWDVIVYGATPGGIMAAIAAANETVDGHAAQVLLIHPMKHVGGMVTGGLGATDKGNPAVIGGLALSFFQRVCMYMRGSDLHAARDGEHAGTGSSSPCFDFTPSAAEAAFLDMLAAYPSLTVLTQQTLVNISMSGNDALISSITTAPSEDVDAGRSPSALLAFKGTIFIDASYEGDLLAAAGVSYTVGREGVDVYNESLAGRLFVPNAFGNHQFMVPVNYTNSTGGVLPMIYTGDPGMVGQGDLKVQAYNFRMCLTNNATAAVPLSCPAEYDPSYWELFRRYIAAASINSIHDVMNIVMVSPSKTDVNNNGPISTDFIGGSWEWPEASPQQRVAIYQAHKLYTQSFFCFLAGDPAVPASMRQEMQTWGLAKDEFVDNDNWPYQLYVREGRRMVGGYVFSQQDRQTNLNKPDSVGLFSYNIDTHNAQRFPQGTFVRNEGDVEVLGNLGPGQIPYRSILPRRSECTNLLVPVAVSASHLGFGALRLEPQWMIIGQSAGVAAVQAINSNVAVQNLNVSALQSRLTVLGQLLEWPPGSS